ncbi:6-bladed beta-propeller [Neobacillus sp. PS3-40]|uniref:6-bladed beta-propeller n=1 Tax=Neobacillus sp. PS3-40 TaxID=3070679 RepID=UPI0027DEF068|nr:6-bladed beta-propeller [Neobacillus sp. PS3-40]WML46055.1 6-bladed beta-propeller [Neobacillus sp. PS3-40]
MKKKTVYIWMSTIVVLVAAVFAVIYYFNLQSDVEKVTKTLDPNAPPTFSQTIYGDFNKTLDKPMDVAKIGEFLYVSDTNNKRVQVFDTAGSPVFMFGKEGDGKGQFKFPYGITGDKEGNVYVADLYNGKISIFTAKGKFIKYFDDKNKLLKSPAGIRIYNEKLYVTDVQQHKVYVLKLNGEKLLEISSGADKNDFLKAPNAITIDKKNDDIFVSDSGNQRILAFDKNGKYLRAINGSKDGKGSSIFVNPRGIGIDSRGILYIVNNLSHMVYGFDKKGTEVFHFGTMGDQNEQFYLPNGLYVDENDRVYITDTLNNRICIYY